MRREKTAAGCGTFGYYMKNILKFLLSHIGLVSLVVGYTIIGAFTFQSLEAEEELKVKKNVTATREKVTDDLWDITEDSLYFEEDLWAEKVRARLQEFEQELIKAMKSSGWDGNEDLTTQQWTFSGALFYSIVLITTIGYGHIAPKTTWGKVVTIFYAIPGVPLMMLCLANIGDGMAQSFRFLYWKVCCYACTKKPRRKRRGKISRVSSRSRYPSSGQSSQRVQRMSSFRRSARVSQKSNDSQLSDSAVYSNYGSDYRMQDNPMDSSPVDQRGRRPKSRAEDEELGRESTRGRGLPDHHSTPSAVRNPHERSRSGEHLEIPGNPEEEDGRSSVLFNKYALEKEGITPDDLTPVHDVQGTSHPRRPASLSDYRDHKKGSHVSRESERTRSKDSRLKEPEIYVTRAPRSAPASLKRSQKSAYLDPPPNPQRDSGFYSRQMLASDPRSRLTKLDEEFYFDDYYDEDEDEYDEDDDEMDDTADKPVPIWLGIMLVVAYIFGGAFLFAGREEWDFLNSVYFCFITLTTIGFGDFVPAQEKKDDPKLSIALCSLYLLFGIALLAMSFNLLQEEVISNVKRVAKRLGIIKEEGEEEEEE